MHRNSQFVKLSVRTFLPCWRQLRTPSPFLLFFFVVTSIKFTILHPSFYQAVILSAPWKAFPSSTQLLVSSGLLQGLPCAFLSEPPQDPLKHSSCCLFFFFFFSALTAYESSHGSNLSCNCDLCLICGNPRSLTQCAGLWFEPMPPQRQHQIPNPLHHRRNSGYLF